MKYNEIYDSLIKRGLERGLNKKKLDYHTEKHHIIPKCMGGVNNNSNYVLLTPREHFVAHQLLVKIYKDTKYFYKLVRALNAMSMFNDKYSRPNAKEYEWVRTLCYNANKLTNAGRKHKPETLRLFSEQRTGANNPMYGRKGELSPSFGKKRSKESNDKIWLNRNRNISQKAKYNISKGKRTSPIWKEPMYNELFNLYVSNPVGGCAFRTKAMSLGYPNTSYHRLVQEFKEITQ
ncbi:homing endonuclease [Klebsiella phage vB_KpnM_KpV477]|uniref:Putative homing endonuclease n=1 Tax=Klebsiella phage vB_KpnM_KpV477 TaxID=1852625 RepID=A0A1B1P929_9CAUD|nr:homing endonuclease [Klebsiella phage vB_KpnM_KpV477]ANT40602.1 putative homing endonuclease [Klebsiella phage vB_KpnM_KpV477]UGO47522.1 putative homing endonuclease [Klebsiella phage vB_KaeM_LilPanda]UNY40965.1 putative homing endonuclease [Klebsiella phage KP182]